MRRFSKQILQKIKTWTSLFPFNFQNVFYYCFCLQIDLNSRNLPVEPQLLASENLYLHGFKLRKKKQKPRTRALKK